MWSILDLSLFYSAFAGDTTLRGRILAEALNLSIITAAIWLYSSGLGGRCCSIHGLVFLIKFSFLLPGRLVPLVVVVVSAAFAAVFVF